MTARDTIQDFLQVLKEQLDAQDACLRQWEKTDWRERLVRLDQLLHGMWHTYEEAEDVASYLKDVFPPYPFEEIKEIKRWLRDARHRIEDFLEEDYKATEAEEYMEAYQKFLRKVCGEESAKGWASREQHIAEKEEELLQMLNKSYSVLLDLLLSCYQSLQEDDAMVLAAYANSEQRYEQLHWKKDGEAFKQTISNRFPWNPAPTVDQLKEYYKELFTEFKNTRCGELFTSHHRDEFILLLAKEEVDDKELRDFYRERKQLEELNTMISNDSKVEGNPYAFVVKPDMIKTVVYKIKEYQKGKNGPKQLTMPVRAAMDAGVIERPTYGQYSAIEEFSSIDKSSFSNYTNPEKTPYVGEAFDAMVRDFQTLI